MKQPDAKPARWKRWGRMTLIPVLMVVLACVVFSAVGSPSNSPSESTEAAATTARQRPKPSAASARPAWPTFGISDVIEFNPFAPPLPPESSVKESDTNSAKVADDKKVHSEELHVLVDRLQAVYQTKEGTVAIIDSRVVRVGDLLDGDQRVVAITPQAVFVEPSLESSSETR